MNKIKKAIENLRNYLGSDKAGVEMLDAVSRLANQLRKSLANAEREAEELRSSIESLPRLIDRQSIEIDELKVERKRLVDLLAQRDFELLRMRRDIEPSDDELDECRVDVLGNREVRFITTASKVAAKHPSPAPYTVFKSPLNLNVHLHDDDHYVRVWSLQELLAAGKEDGVRYLGSAVALLAYTNGTITISSSQFLSDMDVSPATCRRLLRFSSNCIDDQCRVKGLGINLGQDAALSAALREVATGEKVLP